MFPSTRAIGTCVITWIPGSVERRRAHPDHRAPHGGRPPGNPVLGPLRRAAPPGRAASAHRHGTCRPQAPAATTRTPTTAHRTHGSRPGTGILPRSRPPPGTPTLPAQAQAQADNRTSSEQLRTPLPLQHATAARRRNPARAHIPAAEARAPLPQPNSPRRDRSRSAGSRIPPPGPAHGGGPPRNRDGPPSHHHSVRRHLYQRYQRPLLPFGRATKPISHTTRTMTASHHNAFTAKPAPKRMRASRRTRSRGTMIINLRSTSCPCPS